MASQHKINKLYRMCKENAMSWREIKAEVNEICNTDVESLDELNDNELDLAYQELSIRLNIPSDVTEGEVGV